MEIISIAAIANNNVIGNKGKIPWHIREDFKRFKRLTLNHPIIMGRKTYESLPIKPLPKRKNIIITRNKDLKIEDCDVFNSIEDVIKHCKDNNYEKIFLIGGESIYKLGMSLANKLEITHVDIIPEGDTFFPEIDEKEWKAIVEEKHEGYSFVTYIRKTKINKIK